MSDLTLDLAADTVLVLRDLFWLSEWVPSAVSFDAGFPELRLAGALVRGCDLVCDSCGVVGGAGVYFTPHLWYPP